MDERRLANRSRFEPGEMTGHYESFFQRANHPTRPEAFWIRYTIFQPKGRPDLAEGELWAIYFDGETHEHAAAKIELPIKECEFDHRDFRAHVGEATLEANRLRGAAASKGDFISWDLAYDGHAPVMYFLPRGLYDARLPKAKSIVAWPHATYRGKLLVGGREIDVDGWPGSQNHNWGSKHTDTYAWGQVVGFDEAPESTLEAITGKLKLGPVWSPWFTLAVVRHEGKEYLFNDFRTAYRSKGKWSFFRWEFETESHGSKLKAVLTGEPDDFVGLTYRNPPGGTHTCLNSKIARCELTLTPKGGQPVRLTSANRAAFEILTDDASHGVPIRV